MEFHHIYLFLAGVVEDIKCHSDHRGVFMGSTKTLPGTVHTDVQFHHLPAGGRNEGLGVKSSREKKKM